MSNFTKYNSLFFLGAALDSIGGAMFFLWYILPIQYKTLIGSFLFKQTAEGEGFQTTGWYSIACFLLFVGSIMMFLFYIINFTF